MKMAEVRALLKEQDRLDYEDAEMNLKGSDSENETISLIFKGDPRREKDRWLKMWTETYDVPAALPVFICKVYLIPLCRVVTISGEPDANEILVMEDIGRNDITLRFESCPVFNTEWQDIPYDI
jgi:hypothetical protein